MDQAGETIIKPRNIGCSERIKIIGIIADTHIPTRSEALPQKIYTVFRGVDLILHAGDLVEKPVIDSLEIIAPVEAVAGNMDPPVLVKKLGRIKLIRIGAINIGLLHGDLGSYRINPGQIRELFHPTVLKAAVFGHMHEPYNDLIDGTLYFNPGSAVDPRRVSRPSCGILRIVEEQVRGEIIYL